MVTITIIVLKVITTEVDGGVQTTVITTMTVVNDILGVTSRVM